MLDKLQEKYKENRFISFMIELIKRFQEDEVMAVGARLAYYLIMAFFPFLIFLLNIAAFTPLGQEQVIGELFQVLPNQTSELLEPIVMDVISSRSAGLLSVSLLLALWSGSAGINALIKAMGTAFDVENSRAVWAKRLLSILYTFLLAVIILVVLMGPIFGQVLIDLLENFMNLGDELAGLINLGVSLLPIPIMILGFASIYKWGPGFPETKTISFKEALLGATVATFLFLSLSFGFSFYVNNFGNYANTYGALGGVIVLLIWLFLSSTVIMLGAEITATYVAMKSNRIDKRTDETTTEDQKAQVILLKTSQSQKGLGAAIVASIGGFVLIKAVKSILD